MYILPDNIPARIRARGSTRTFFSRGRPLGRVLPDAQARPSLCYELAGYRGFDTRSHPAWLYFFVETMEVAIDGRANADNWNTQTCSRLTGSRDVPMQLASYEASTTTTSCSGCSRAARHSQPAIASCDVPRQLATRPAVPANAARHCQPCIARRDVAAIQQKQQQQQQNEHQL